MPGPSAAGAAGRPSACWTSAGLTTAALRAMAAGSVDADAESEAVEVAVVDVVAVVDGATAWALGQSFSKLAKRTHTTLVRIPPETTVALVAAYAARWDAARPLLHAP